MKERIKQFNQLIADSKSIVFFGGAGVSTESGIPDFRSKDGLYNTPDIRFDKYDPEYLLSRECMLRNPEVFFEYYRQKLDCRNIEPNITHKILAEMERNGKMNMIITQNIDGLHQKAGSQKVAEIHGTTKRNLCRKCYREIDGDFIFTNTEPIPHCPYCGGIVRPRVVLYGEELPNAATDAACNAIAEADLIIIGGTSLKVYPAASFIPNWKKWAAKMVIINREHTSMDKECDIIFHEGIGEVFKQLKF